MIGLGLAYLSSTVTGVDTVTQQRRDGRDEIQIEHDYYHYTHKLSAIRHTTNPYPDSIWVKYDIFGNLTERIVHKKVHSENGKDSTLRNLTDK